MSSPFLRVWSHRGTLLLSSVEVSCETPNHNSAALVRYKESSKSRIAFPIQESQTTILKNGSFSPDGSLSYAHLSVVGKRWHFPGIVEPSYTHPLDSFLGTYSRMIPESDKWRAFYSQRNACL
ncbi:hypothetical protein CEXT_587531 [Caerostris extrusa]|uniref:Uncharacterized protein n=1 Tax=Caerostris extrusa TaxID=172846 RepID=A0AAV4R5H8_CAEEX|nr:hypothetical protein CEXT_587531 [Caerostris extrusa]